MKTKPLPRLRIRRDTLTLSAQRFADVLTDPSFAQFVLERAMEHADQTGRTVSVTVAKPLTISPSVYISAAELEAMQAASKKKRRRGLRVVK